MPIANRLLIAIITWEVLVLLTLPLRAQEQQTPKNRALMERIGIEVNGNLACAEATYALRDRVSELERQLAASKAKETPQPDTADKEKAPQTPSEPPK